MANYKKKSNAQEKRVAKQINGKPTIASGALYFQKADVRNDLWLVECKTTQKSIYILKESIWNKIEKEAIKDGLRHPLMQIDLLDGEINLVVMNYFDFIGYDFDKEIFVQPPIQLVDHKSMILSAEWLYPDISTLDLKNKTYYTIKQIKFLLSQKHLVVMTLSDFLHLSDKYIER